MQKPSIIVKDLIVKTQEKTVLDGISFSLNPNEHLAILGSAESGKTTLANALSGKIHFAGTITTDFFNVTDKQTRIELVEQRYNFKNLSGVSDFYYQQRFNSFDADDAPTIFQELSKANSTSGKTTMPSDSRHTNNIDFALEVLGIDHLKDAPLIQLSSGEHKRFQLAKALLNPPQALILDTPYTGLDIDTCKKLNEILEEISKTGTQIILIPGTFPVPDFITHVASLQIALLSYFGKKQNYEAPIPAEEVQSEAYDTNLIPVADDEVQFNTIVEMKNIHLNYGSHVILQNLNWTIRQGEKWLLRGRNGAGKSSLLNMITGDHPQAYSNEIYLFGKRRGSGESIWDIKQKTGYISPELHAYFDKNITCVQAIGSGYFDTIGLYKKLNKTQHGQILQWLDFLQISHVSTKPLHSISASLQRMILLARALVKNPPLLVLDEPCQGLDHHQSNQFVSLIDHICGNTNKTLIYVSHDETNIPSCIEKVLHLENTDYKIKKISRQRSSAMA
jgi:molybdate transport system ATP-binding protein